MESTQIKNWSYVLSYKEITELDDFEKLLVKAIAKNNCLLCGSIGRPIGNSGLCCEDSDRLDKEDKEAEEKVCNNYKVSIRVSKK